MLHIKSKSDLAELLRPKVFFLDKSTIKIYTPPFFLRCTRMAFENEVRVLSAQISQSSLTGFFHFFPIIFQVPVEQEG